MSSTTSKQPDATMDAHALEAIEASRAASDRYFESERRRYEEISKRRTAERESAEQAHTQSLEILSATQEAELFEKNRRTFAHLTDAAFQKMWATGLRDQVVGDFHVAEARRRINLAAKIIRQNF